MGEVEDRLKGMGVELPPPPSPMGAYVPAVTTGRLVFVSGQLPRWGDELKYTGKVDAELSLEDAKKAARLAALNAVSVLKAEVGDLDRVKRIVRLQGSVVSSPGFVNQPQVVNAASDVMLEVFGEAGKHARMAVGVAEMPANAGIAVELIAEIEPAG
jgi:enamine deaminase RidA (YjgF/YER057c/UK114 family)